MKKHIATKQPKGLVESRLQRLVDSDGWEELISRSQSNATALDDLIVAFENSKSSKLNHDIDSIRLRIGGGLLEKMGWKIGDKLILANHPDDLMLFKLFKPDSPLGRKLSSENNSHVARVAFRWDRSIQLERKQLTKVKYHIYKDRVIIFHATDDTALEG